MRDREGDAAPFEHQRNGVGVIAVLDLQQEEVGLGAVGRVFKRAFARDMQDAACEDGIIAVVIHGEAARAEKVHRQPLGMGRGVYVDGKFAIRRDSNAVCIAEIVFNDSAAGQRWPLPV